MRLVFKTFGNDCWEEDNPLNMAYSAAHSVTLTTEEDPNLEFLVYIQYIPANYAGDGDAAKIEIKDNYSSTEYKAWKRAQAVAPDTSLLINQYLAFWNEWNVKATAKREEKARLLKIKQDAQAAENKALILQCFPGCVQWEAGKTYNGWSYRDVKHDGFALIHKNGMAFCFVNHNPKWSVTMRSDKIGCDYDFKKSKDIKKVFKHILDSEQVAEWIKRHDQRIEWDRKEKVLNQTMAEAGWKQEGSDFVKIRDSGKYYARAEIEDTSDRVIIKNIRKHIQGITLSPHKMDICIFE